MASHDPLGYYKALGVLPDASPAVIRAVYRARAMELHPDRNKGADATRQFQELQRAYEVLSDAKAREAYDAGAVNPAADQAASPNPTRYEPVRCSRCGVVSAQPRYRVFHSVIGYVVGAVKRTHAGVVCARCETVVALKATGTTMVLGWWSIHGFFWSIGSILTNLVGGQKFPEQDARILAHQAMYFDSIGKQDLARAIATQAYNLAFKVRPDSAMAKKRAALGYDDPDPLSDMRAQLISYLDSFKDQGDAKELRAPSRVLNSRFLSQFALLAVVVGSIGLWIAVEAQRAAEMEQSRLERAGIERATAALIAANRAEELRKLQQPLPPSGVYPIYAAGRFDTDSLPPFKIKTAAGSHYFLKLCDWQTGVVVMNIFIRGGEEVEVGVPPGTYRIKFASGATWYGEKVRFGPDTAYSVVDTPSEFSVSGGQLQGHELQLVNVVNGNLRRRPIDATQF
jgi:hypothetical protein